jgi:hypothetical protein
LLRTGGNPATATWRASLAVPAAGEYAFRLQSPGEATLTIGSDTVIHLPEAGAQENRIWLEAGATPIALRLDLPQGTNGALELMWQVPGLDWSILPHMMLTPDTNLLWQEPLPEDALLIPDNFPRDEPTTTVR